MDKKKIKVTLIHEDKKVCEKTVEFATPVFDIIDAFGLPVENIYAVKINNEVRPLDTPVQFTANIEPILNTGHLFMHEKIKQTILLSEMLAWTPVGSAEHDDGLDAIAGAIAMLPCPIRPVSNHIGLIKANTEFQI